MQMCKWAFAIASMNSSNGDEILKDMMVLPLKSHTKPELKRFSRLELQKYGNRTKTHTFPSAMSTSSFACVYHRPESVSPEMVGTVVTTSLKSHLGVCFTQHVAPEELFASADSASGCEKPALRSSSSASVRA